VGRRYLETRNDEPIRLRVDCARQCRSKWREQLMIEIKSGLKGVTDKERWAARGASFVAKAKATKVVWFPPRPVETGKKAASATAKATKSATRSAASKTTGAAKGSTGAARKAGGAVKKSPGSAKKAPGTAKRTSATAKRATDGVKKVSSPVSRKKG
jgi:hypothetical protein